MRSEAATVEAYLLELPADRRAAISELRKVIRGNLPKGYVEAMNWGMIAYEVPLAINPKTYNGKPLMYAALAAQKVAPGDGFLGREVSIGDLAVAIPFGNLKWARVEPDTSRWPRTCAWIARTRTTPALAKVTRLAEAVMQAPPDRHRKVLAELGVQLTDSTVATDKPRRGPMSV